MRNLLPADAGALLCWVMTLRALSANRSCFLKPENSFSLVRCLLQFCCTLFRPAARIGYPPIALA